MSMRDNMKSQGRSARKKRRVILYVIVALLIIFVVCFASFLIVKAVGKSSLDSKAVSAAPMMQTALDTETGSDEEGFIYRNGKKYRQNEEIYTILCMGIDTSDTVSEEGGKMGTGGQSDANFLLVLDETNKKMSVIAIPRDTITDIDIYDAFGQYFDTVEEHLALQYAYGDGGKLSCELSEKAVSNLLYNIPINAYVSINMDAIQVLNKLVGGVTVEVTDDISNSFASLKAGDTVTLNEKQAYLYVRSRDCKEDFSAQQRLERQKNYLISFIGEAIKDTKSDITFPLKVFNSIADYMITDISASEVTYLATVAMGCSFSADHFYAVPGKQQKGAYYEEYRVDDDALYDLMLELFYLPAEE